MLNFHPRPRQRFGLIRRLAPAVARARGHSVLAAAALIGAGGTLPQDRTAAQRLDQYFSALARDDQFSGTVLVANHGRVIYEGSFGTADVATQRPNTPATTFPIASITKTFTATAILQLRDQGRLRLNDPVVRYLPTFPYAKITIRHPCHTRRACHHGMLF